MLNVTTVRTIGGWRYSRKSAGGRLEICSLRIDAGSCIAPNADVSRVVGERSVQLPQETANDPHNIPIRSRL